ncbi:hypothetical protein [Roseivivax isoporae]|uniref:Nutrient deprivation-induced protein n=1 Tax=Roseivivax isoporae LMG 25204 TaxID=1449351 RepID=X7F7Q8_9RHOB|nr:hypothetical protein [Roseivivax isoporae]ETX28952.1 hypothetical protein RISW2_04355 [Roseivivax isoporae LMG 25204]
MSDTHDTTRNAGREAGEDVRRSAERLGHDARSAAEDVGRRAQDQAFRQMESAKGGIASELAGLARALRAAAGELTPGSIQERGFDQMAGGLDSAADTVRDRDLGQLADDISGMARRNPIGFLGGAALLGFAATRFAKASSRHGGTVDATVDAPSHAGATTEPATVPAEPKRPGDL